MDERVDLAHPARWVDASEVAVYLGTDREWVYRHGLELDGRELGSGPKAPWRFKLSLVDAALGGCPVLLVHRYPHSWRRAISSRGVRGCGSAMPHG